MEQLFTNFVDKSPESLLRRIDPDYYYPTFGDDGTVEETAPTLGKFFVKLKQPREPCAVGQLQGRLPGQRARPRRPRALRRQRPLPVARDDQLRRAAPGARRLRRRAGHRAEPGGVPRHRRLPLLPAPPGPAGRLRARADRGAGQGLRARVGRGAPAAGARLRHRLSPGPRPAHRAPLDRPRTTACSSAAAASAATRPGWSSSTSTRPASRSSTRWPAGGQGQYWFNDFVKLGLTANNNDEGDADSSLYAADLTLRKSTDSWFKLQAGRSEGLVSNSLLSDDGGFGFFGPQSLDLDRRRCQRVPRRPQRGVRGLLRGRAGAAEPLRAEPGRGLFGAGPDHAHRHGAVRRPVQDAADGQAEPGREGGPAGADGRARDDRPGGRPRLPADRSLEPEQRRPERAPRGRLPGRAGDPGGGRAHRRGGAAGLRLAGEVAQLRLRAGDAGAERETARTTGASASAAPIASTIVSASTARSRTATSDRAASSGRATSIPTAPTCISTTRWRTSGRTTACTARGGNLIAGARTRLSDSTSVYAREEAPAHGLR